jgi:2-polyprenyl-3-methyl-5-hydroxy-6-metoxy-1,4-benzoquinol methylase
MRDTVATVVPVNNTPAFARRIVQIARTGRPNLGDVLDAGSGRAEILRAVEPYAESLTAIDQDPNYVATASKLVPRARVSLASIEDGLGFSAFDTIFFCDVIEHVCSPYEALTTLRKSLRPAGRIIVTTPNASSIVRIIEGRRWFDLVQDDLILFSPITLFHLLGRCGFSVVRLCTVSTHPIASVILEPLGTAASILAVATRH